MKTLNRENYNEVMFELLENEIQGEERHELLRQIDEDPFYKAQWEFWQQSMVHQASVKNVPGTDEFLEGLLVKPEKKRLFITRKWMIAASILLLCSLALLTQRNSNIEIREGVATVDDSSKMISGSNGRNEKAMTTRDSSDDNQPVAVVTDEDKKVPSQILKSKRTFLVPGREERRQLPVQSRPDSGSTEQHKTEQVPDETLIATTSDSIEVNPVQIVSVELGSAGTSQNKRFSLGGLLTNTKIRLKKVKNKPAISVEGEESTLVISLQQ